VSRVKPSKCCGPFAGATGENPINTDCLTLGGTANCPPFSWFRNRFIIGLDHAQPQARLLFLPATSISRRPSLTVHPHNKNAIDLVRIECDTSLSNERIMTP